MSSGSIWSHVLGGEDAIPRWRSLMGPTKVLKTVHEAPDSIRGRYGLTDTRNCTHGSDSDETAQREIKFFFPEFDGNIWLQENEESFRQGQVKFDPYICEHIPYLHHQ